MYRRAKPMAPGQVTIDNFDSNIRMKIDPSRSMGAAIYRTGFHEFREFLFMHRFLKAGMTFVDIGANQGEYSLFASKRIGNGQVIAFEPLPSIRTALLENIRLNNFKNIVVMPVGLSDQRGTMSIHEIDDAHEGLATLYPGDQVSRNTFTIDLHTLDEVFTTNNFSKCDMIKLDIEGGELNALRGARNVLEKFRPALMIEINAITYTKAGYTIDDVGKFMSDMGYRAFKIVNRGVLAPCGPLPDFGNIVFLPG